MAKVRFAPKDAKIIKDNPGKSPYELRELGLSDKAFAKLMSGDDTNIKPQSDPELEKADPKLETPSGQDKKLEAGKEEQPDPELKDQAGNVIDGTAEVPGPNPHSDSAKNKLIPKLETPSGSRMPKASELKAQVMVQAPNGTRNTMGRTFALKLIKQDPRYKIIG